MKSLSANTHHGGLPWKAGGGWEIRHKSLTHTVSKKPETASLEVFKPGGRYRVKWNQEGGFVAVYADHFQRCLAISDKDGDREKVFVSRGGTLCFRSKDNVTIKNVHVKLLDEEEV